MSGMTRAAATWTFVVAVGLFTAALVESGSPWYLYAALAVIVVYVFNLARASYLRGYSDALLHSALSQMIAESEDAEAAEQELTALLNGHGKDGLRG